MNVFTSKRFSWNTANGKLPTGFNNKDTPLFNVDIPVSNNWDSKEKKLLIICEHVDSADLKAKALCSDYYGEVLSNLLKESIEYANLTLDAGRIADYGISVVNWAYFKSYHLDSKRQSIAEKSFTRRVEDLMEKLEPTHVIVLGDRACRSILELEFYREKRGWVHSYEKSWGSFHALSTIDPADLITVSANSNQDAALDDSDDEDDEEGGGRDLYSKTNLLGQVYRDMSSIFTHGKVDNENGLVYSIAGVAEKAKHILLTDYNKIESLFERLIEAGKFAYDTELRSLNRIDNKLLTMQFSLDEKTGFVIPYLHKDSPFVKSPTKLAGIRDMAYELFCNGKHDPFSTTEYIIGTNLQFDLTMTREQLRIPIITKPIFDIQFGDFNFDENIAELDNYAGPTPAAWSLASICTRFGSNAYLDKEGFNKEDRKNMEATSLADVHVIEYMSYDVVLPFAIHNEQRRRARAINYKKYDKMVLGQQSNLAHAFSVMEHKGVDVDLKYLASQMLPDSPMKTILSDAKEQLYESEGAKAANEQLANDRGVDTSGGLFADMEDDDAPFLVQIFDISKQEHQQMLFQDVLELDAVSGFGKKVRPDGNPSMKLDKGWQTEHREVYEVSLYTSINKISKLISSYIKSFYLKITESDDGKKDGKLHPSFGCLYVKTGRGNSFKPSLQQTPSRGKLAKYVKRMFAVKYGYLKLKSDYSANEIRFGANLSKDDIMAEPFNVARALRSELFWASIEEAKLKFKNSNDPKVLKSLAELEAKLEDIKKRLKREGDIHIANIYRFFKRWVLKSDPLRDSIKAIVFG